MRGAAGNVLLAALQLLGDQVEAAGEFGELVDGGQERCGPRAQVVLAWVLSWPAEEISELSGLSLVDVLKLLPVRAAVLFTFADGEAAVLISPGHKRPRFSARKPNAPA